MIKSIVIVTLLVLFCSISAFATDTENPENALLNLSATIQGESNIKITDATLSTLTSDQFDAAASYAQYTILGSTKTGPIAYVHVKTNKHTNFSITMTATALTSANNSSKIDYTAYLDEDDNNVTYTTNASSNTNNVLTDGHGNGNAYGIANGNGWAWGNALQIFSYPVAVDLDDASYEAALEDTYTGTVTFNYSVS
jgi:hypothetical protein